MTTGSRVRYRSGWGYIVGWQGAEAIVALDSGEYVTVDVTSLRRAR